MSNGVHLPFFVIKGECVCMNNGLICINMCFDRENNPEHHHHNLKTLFFFWIAVEMELFKRPRSKHINYKCMGNMAKNNLTFMSEASNKNTVESSLIACTHAKRLFYSIQMTKLQKRVLHIMNKTLLL